MNIFILDEDPVRAAQLQCDKHIVKMPLESAQMLSTVHRMLDGTETRRPSKSGKTMVKYWELDEPRESILYKAVHYTHPCTVWSMESVANYNWHYEHFVALHDEFVYRYGKTHGSFFPVFRHAGTSNQLFAVWTYARVETQFQWYKTPFDSQGKRLELLGRLNEIPGVSLPEDCISKRPSIPMDLLSNDEALAQFKGIFEWFIEEAQKV